MQGGDPEGRRKEGERGERGERGELVSGFGTERAMGREREGIGGEVVVGRGEVVVGVVETGETEMIEGREPEEEEEVEEMLLEVLVVLVVVVLVVELVIEEALEKLEEVVKVRVDEEELEALVLV